MLTSTFIVLIVVFCISLFISKDLFHPASIVSGLWMTLIGLYLYADHPLWNLSDKFSLCLLLWVIPFCLSSLFSCFNPVKPAVSTIAIPFSQARFSFLYKLNIIYLIIFSLYVISMCGFSFTAYRSLMVSESLPPLLTLLLYANTFFSVFLFYAIFHYRHISKTKLLILLIGAFLIILFKSNKTSILALFVSVLYILKVNKKLSIKLLFVLVSILSTFLVVLTLNRADYDFESEKGLINFIYIYLLSPLTAFDALINNQYTLNPGAPWSNTLSFIYKILNVLGANINLGELGSYIYVPLPTNVFTTMRGFYLDGGLLGIFIVSIILGLFLGNIYSYQRKKHIVHILFYAAIYTGLFFQHFGDYFFYSLSMIIQYYMFSHIIVRGVRVYNFKL